MLQRLQAFNTIFTEITSLQLVTMKEDTWWCIWNLQSIMTTLLPPNWNLFITKSNKIQNKLLFGLPVFCWYWWLYRGDEGYKLTLPVDQNWSNGYSLIYIFDAVSLILLERFFVCLLVRFYVYLVRLYKLKSNCGYKY